jgi:hypothetical protein
MKHLLKHPNFSNAFFIGAVLFYGLVFALALAHWFIDPALLLSITVMVYLAALFWGFTKAKHFFHIFLLALISGLVVAFLDGQRIEEYIWSFFFLFLTVILLFKFNLWTKFHDGLRFFFGHHSFAKFMANFMVLVLCGVIVMILMVIFVIAMVRNPDVSTCKYQKDGVNYEVARQDWHGTDAIEYKLHTYRSIGLFNHFDDGQSIDDQTGVKLLNECRGETDTKI